LITPSIFVPLLSHTWQVPSVVTYICGFCCHIPDSWLLLSHTWHVTSLSHTWHVTSVVTYMTVFVTYVMLSYHYLLLVLLIST
jgi:hypothetical protein